MFCDVHTEYPQGKISSVFTPRHCAVNDFQRTGILGTHRLESQQQSGVCIFDLHGLRALLHPGEYSLWFTCQQLQSHARLGSASGIAASLTFVCLAFLIGPSIKNSSPEEMVPVYHFWTIVLAIAGMVLYFICFKSTRENVVRIVGAAVIEDQSANAET